MKKQILVGIALCSLLTLTLCQQADFFAADAAHAALNRPTEAMPNLQGQPAIDYLKQNGLFERMQQTIEADRHEVKWSQTPRGVVGWRAKNPKQNIEASFSREGALITPGQSCDGASWQMALTLRGVGYGNRLNAIVSGPMQTKGNRVEFQKIVGHHEGGVQSTITEWYVNKPEGIEQGFTLNERPERTFAIEPLRVAMSVSSELHASLTDEGQAITFAYKKGQQVLRYDHLVAYDALGRRLPSRMEVSDGGVSLLVDDRVRSTR